MTNKKDIWKASYIWMRYYGYRCVHYDKEKQEIWLANKTKQRIAIFKSGEHTSQSLAFDKQRILEHQNDINDFLKMTITHYDVYFFTDKPFNSVSLNEREPLQLKFYAIENMQMLTKKMTNPIAKRHLLTNDNKPSHTYKKRVLNQNPIEYAMYYFTPATYSLISINILIWIIITWLLPHSSDIEIINLGALAHFNVVHGEWYRLISSMFLHLDIEHLILNMMSLYIFGKLIESYTSSLKTIGIYFFTGIMGNLVTLAFITNSFSVGASGAIFGLLGALIAMLTISQLYDRKTILQLLAAAVFMAVISLLVRNVNIVAHLGGLIGGIIIVYLTHFYHTYRKGFYWLVAGTIVLIVSLLVKTFMTPDENIYNHIIQDEMNSNHYSEAKNMVKQTIDNNYADDMTYYLSGMITAAQDSKAEALAEWERGLRIFPDSVQLNYIMAITNRSLGDEKSARKFINKASKLAPQNENVKILKRELDA
ncbi:rhomboid family protein [Staphylococcus americanisciuri]|uniref:Rhomboid family intramembrane serine protease n=1 Tax=Staphylococcus americanisciuri TaxID=2973940 RepID=A0ABT2EZR6_9STAP|nr:rhomboid family intramembrane serine protease [Staphylococcus americanisciuri]MCS4485531.1 rhomboid family intramembrane serine protease [Staphylococcus americanisciuri]